jgi:hypothetical protein
MSARESSSGWMRRLTIPCQNTSVSSRRIFHTLSPPNSIPRRKPRIANPYPRFPIDRIPVIWHNRPVRTTCTLG